ncbi:MAG: hypothetical protein OXI97_06985 [Acidimicrobiaceae bacterium]|nr:hypothetical protein [Acidimicrobiaceae bacterium]
MNAEGLLQRTVAAGAAYEIAAADGTTQTVQCGHLQIAAAKPVRASKDIESRVRSVWRKRVGNTGLNLLLLADDPDAAGNVLTMGPRSDRDAPIHSVPANLLVPLLAECADMVPLDAVRHVSGEIVRLADGGVLAGGLLPRHTLDNRLPLDSRLAEIWQSSADDLRFDGDWQRPLVQLGWAVERLEPQGWLLRSEHRPAAVVHPMASADGFDRLDRDGRPPEGVLTSACRAHGARYGIMASGNRYRLFDCDPSASTAEWLDLDATLLDEGRRSLLSLLSPAYLADGGLDEAQRDAQLFGAALRQRLDNTIRSQALPALAEGLERWAREQRLDIDSEACRTELQQAALTLLFRLLFVLYAEGSGFLPMSIPAYRRRSVSELVSEASQSSDLLSDASTALWTQVRMLTQALRLGNDAWGVPAYNGALFAPSGFNGAELLESLELSDPCFAKVLIAVGHDSEVGAGVDYSSLEISHLGHIYETLLSLQLTVAADPVRYDPKRDRYIADAKHPDVPAGSLLWQTHEGGRKAGGVYYTPATLVRHLVAQAVAPAFKRHLDDVRGLARTDPEAAAELLLKFAVLDPACGSAHFLVQVTECLAELAVTFLADTPLPAIKRRIDSLRSQSQADADASDNALLRRLLLKHCVYGTDVSQMGAEIATLSLWLASFVPGLSLAYLGRNIVVGNALLGVADPASVIPEGTMQAASLEVALADASSAAARVAEIGDRTPDEVVRSVAAAAEARIATEGMRRLFDLWTAEGFGVEGARYQAELHGPAVIDGTNGNAVGNLVTRAADIAERHCFLHWPLEFPAVFSQERGGFDAVVGNPPWEEVTVEKLSFFGLHRPGLQALEPKRRKREVERMAAERPELEPGFVAEQDRVATERAALASGEYEPTRGDPDLYKYFCQRYRRLLRPGGTLGVVLPRSTFVNKGSEGFREWLFTRVSTDRIDLLVNTGRWAFDSEPRYSVALVAGEKSEPSTEHKFELLGVADSARAWEAQSCAAGVPVAQSTLGEGWLVPRLRSQAEAELLAKVRTGSPFPLGPNASWLCFPVAELHETNDARLWQSGRGSEELWKGESFDQYQPHGAASRPVANSADLRRKVSKQRPGAESLVAKQVPVKERRAAVATELQRARLAFRDVTRSDDSRTVRACLVPSGVFLTNTAPYLAFPNGTPLDQATCLGLINSLPFDWQARRYVEIHVNFFVLESMCVPDLSAPDRSAIAANAARLSCVDDRFADAAVEFGVQCGPLSDDEFNRLRADIDARVARSWGFAEDDFAVMFDDFTLDAVPQDYRTQVVELWRELD